MKLRSILNTPVDLVPDVLLGPRYFLSPICFCFCFFLFVYFDKYKVCDFLVAKKTRFNVNGNKKKLIFFFGGGDLIWFLSASFLCVVN